VSEVEGELEREAEHQVTPLELFFDLVFVFAITQVTSLLAHDPTWHGVLRGMLVLAALWWAWTAYAWLTSTMDVDEGGVRLAMLASMGAMLFVALAVPGAFGDDAVLFGISYLLVRLLHVVLYAIVGRDDPDLLGAVLRFAPTAIFGASLIVLAGFLHGNTRITVWVVALAIDYIGPAVIGAGRGWRIAPEHFAERHGLIILIALGESIVAIGVGAGFELVARVIVAAALGIVVVSALWWLYFDVAAILARRQLTQASGVAQASLARDAYSYLHLPLVAGVVLFAFGLKTTLGHANEELATVPAVGLCGGVALYLLGHIAFLLRTTRRLWRRRTIGAVVLLALIPATLVIPALGRGVRDDPPARASDAGAASGACDRLAGASDDECQPVDALDPDGVAGVRALVAARPPQLALNPDLSERTARSDDGGFLADHRLCPGPRLPAPRQAQTPGEFAHLDRETTQDHGQVPGPRQEDQGQHDRDGQRHGRLTLRKRLCKATRGASRAGGPMPAALAPHHACVAGDDRAPELLVVGHAAIVERAV
jgi:low temperature requirement protein LtrA